MTDRAVADAAAIAYLQDERDRLLGTLKQVRAFLEGYYDPNPELMAPGYVLSRIYPASALAAIDVALANHKREKTR